MAPLLVHELGLMVRVPPPTASIVPALVKVLVGRNVSVWPALDDEIRPLLTRLLLPPLSHCSPIEL